MPIDAVPPIDDSESSQWRQQAVAGARDHAGMRVDVLDLGSNTFHLASFEVRNSSLRPLTSAKAPVRLGDTAFETGRIDAVSARRGLKSIGTLLDEVRGDGGGDAPLVAVATGVFREVINSRDFLADVHRDHGIPVRVISGNVEARLTWEGVRSEMPDRNARIAVFDLGGGSLDVAMGSGGDLEFTRSLPLGVLRMHRKWFEDSGDREPEDRARALRETVCDGSEAVARAIRAAEPDEVVFSSGTARALLRLAREMGMPEDVHCCLGRQTLFQLAALLASLDAKAVESLGVPASRADTLGPGAVILSTLVELLHVPYVRIASRALREGAALAAAGEIRGGESLISA